MGRITQRESVFRSLVANAGDFLQQSLLYLEESPKLSLIHFCTAIELFLKARLMSEHWSLVFEKPGEADFTQFVGGDFTSVNLHASLVRLNNIAQAGIPKEAIECFKGLQRHRNRLVHFSHPAYSPPASRDAQEAVLAEQLRAWYHLHNLIQLRWYVEFSGVESLINHLNQLMHRRADFLKVKFNELATDIKKLQAAGAIFALCPSCGFESSGHLLQMGPLQVSRCLVCSHLVKSIAAHCSACGAESTLKAGESRQCTKCGAEITLADLLAEYEPKLECHEGELPSCAYCNECEYTKDKTVVPSGNAYLCVNCFSPHDSIARCRWCDSVVTGETGDYNRPACIMCKQYIIDEADA